MDFEMTDYPDPVAAIETPTDKRPIVCSPRTTPPRKDLPSVEDPTSSHRRTITSLGKVTEDFCSLPDFSKSWYLQFSTIRKLQERKSHVNLLKELHAEGDELDMFLADAGHTNSRCAVDVIKQFCQGICLDHVVGAKGRAGLWRSVWLDDRNHNWTCIPELEKGGDARRCENPLSATGLYQALEKERFEHDHLPDAARRLIYISDLDPACIHALAATASVRQTPVLINAIYKHLHFQSSIAVTCPSSGLLTFALNLHLPFFISLDTPPNEPMGGVNTKPLRKWTDLSFLETQVQKPKKVWGMYEAHFSCVVTGSDEWRWVAYGFVDTEIDGILHESSEDDLKRDQIASGVLEADIPFWRPRDYWLKVFEIRIEQVKIQWEYLISKVRLGVDRYLSEHDFTLAGRSGIAQEEDAEIKAAFDWAIQAMSLLCRLDEVLSSTVDAWKSFSGPNGDRNYFRGNDLSRISPHACRSLHAIESSFWQLQETQKQISLLNKSCSVLERNLQLLLVVNSKETADGNGKTSEFTVSVLYPVALAAAIFSMQQQAIPFALNPNSFMLTSLLLIITVYATRLISRHAASRILFLQRWVTIWFTRRKTVGKSGENGFQPRIIGDEERNVLETRALHGGSRAQSNTSI